MGLALSPSLKKKLVITEALRLHTVTQREDLEMFNKASIMGRGLQDNTAAVPGLPFPASLGRAILL